MASKILKKPVQRSTNSSQIRRRRRTPTKNGVGAATAAAIASLHRTFSISRRSILSIFFKFAQMYMPKPPKKQRVEPLPSPPPSILPPSKSPEKMTVFVDLDETMVHSTAGSPPPAFDFAVEPTINGQSVTIYVQKRPGVDGFLAAMGRRFEVVVFTAGMEEYASLVLDRLDPTAVISHRLYRDACKQEGGKMVKDLSGMGRDLGRVVIVDDNPNAYELQPENAIPVSPFIGDPRDRELQRVIHFFDTCDGIVDMRDAAANYRSGCMSLR